MSSLFAKINRILTTPASIIPALGMRGMLHWMPDKTYLELCCRALLGKKVDLNNPQSYNEKLQWLKLYDRKPEYTARVDKYEVKSIAESIIGKQYIVPVLGVYESFDEINFFRLPNQFVIKATHNSCGVFICKDKENGQYFAKDGSPVSFPTVRKQIAKMLKENYYFDGREWPYKNVKPRVIVDPYLQGEIQDYKLLCFNGKVKIIYIEAGRSSSMTCDFYDRDFNKLDMEQANPNSDIKRAKPRFLDEIVMLAEKLSAGIQTVRIDFFEAEGKLYFAEFTFFNWAGFVPFVPAQWDDVLGKWLVLPNC